MVFGENGVSHLPSSFKRRPHSMFVFVSAVGSSLETMIPDWSSYGTWLFIRVHMCLRSTLRGKVQAQECGRNIKQSKLCWESLVLVNSSDQVQWRPNNGALRAAEQINVRRITSQDQAQMLHSTNTLDTLDIYNGHESSEGQLDSFSHAIQLLSSKVWIRIATPCSDFLWHGPPIRSHSETVRLSL